MKTLASLCCSAVRPDSVASPAHCSPYFTTNKCVLSGLNTLWKNDTISLTRYRYLNWNFKTHSHRNFYVQFSIWKMDRPWLLCHFHQTRWKAMFHWRTQSTCQCWNKLLKSLRFETLPNWDRTQVQDRNQKWIECFEVSVEIFLSHELSASIIFLVLHAT